MVRLSDDLRLDRQMRHDIEVVIDRLAAGPKSRSRLAEAVELALRLGDGNLLVAAEEEGEGGRRKAEGGSGRRKPRKADGGSDADPSAFRRPPADIITLGPLRLHALRLSFEPPSPQLFSFNSPQGMCPECNGLGRSTASIPSGWCPIRRRSFQQGCIELLGSWREMGRWRRHIFRGVAEMLERKYGLEPGTVLETAWEELDAASPRRPCSGAPATST